LARYIETDWLSLLKSRAKPIAIREKVNSHEVIKAITVLSYRISGIGLYPEFINAHPELTEYESPFLVQNREIIEFIQQYKKHH
jgi:site-specific recombinase